LASGDEAARLADSYRLHWHVVAPQKNLRSALIKTTDEAHECGLSTSTEGACGEVTASTTLTWLCGSVTSATTSTFEKI
jgi:hypothetical protein